MRHVAIPFSCRIIFLIFSCFLGIYEKKILIFRIGLVYVSGYYESLQDRLSSIEEARQAVEALREEHERRRQQELLNAQRLRQIQMQQKLEVMRHKKHVRLV